MELLQLRYFRTVARMEHMTKAAQELLIAQPALSKTISRLEEDVGVPLFDRHGGRIRLNTFGKVFLDKVEKALALLEEGKKEVSELAGLEQGSIHLATSTLDRLSDALGEFLALHPEVNFKITQTSMEEMAQLVEAGGVDLCFTPLPIDRPDISTVSVLKEEVYLAVPQGHRLAGRKSIRLSELAEDPFIGYKEGFPFQKMNDLFFQEAGITPNFVCRVDEPAGIASLVRTGLGVALVGNCGGPSSAMSLLRIESPVCQRNFQIIWHEKRYLSLAARRFRDFLIKYFAQAA
ncbi:DNA-binding transcriptional regulator, LysR family [Paenibacillus sp. UNCCL117]|uniref:LysR family transcriptional regulator n=1 Tax=unclassified Paenibacillus TaxID=185978 RepID=UPI00088D4E49|nr:MULTISPECIES: LysR family transcriptional regulator [unclassified Paenibacillus]SDD83850.1 DNA-binding transcriptional regulator, LysR family [Paenibacillus sp. cl123]SFW54754.1 DNA-binding transcriptional regulator, LysR family [Paenibacillus sp. UNCCL117]